MQSGVIGVKIIENYFRPVLAGVFSDFSHFRGIVA
jgi:hypothetical protein